MSYQYQYLIIHVRWLSNGALCRAVKAHQNPKNLNNNTSVKIQNKR